MTAESERKICWRVTRACNLNCLHCLAGFKNRFIQDQDIEARQAVLSTVIAAKVTRITWSGGEPTLAHGMEGLLATARENDIQNLITTHGLSLRSRFLSSLDPRVDRFRISFDGLEKTHNRIRGGNFFNRTLSAVERLNHAGFVTEANVTVTADSFTELSGLCHILAEAGITKVVFLSLMNRESAEQGLVRPVRKEERKEFERIIRGKIGLPDHVDYEFNNYDSEDDCYVVIESDGTIILTSETEEDKEVGSAIGPQGINDLQDALSEQNLRHRMLEAA